MHCTFWCTVRAVTAIHTRGACRKETNMSPEMEVLLFYKWALVQSDKTGQWLPMRVKDYISDMQIHIQ